MTAIFKPEGPLFRATEHAGGPWSPDMLQGSATTALMTREVERLAKSSGFAVRRLTFDLWRPAGLRAFGLATDMLRDGRKVLSVWPRRHRLQLKQQWRFGGKTRHLRPGKYRWFLWAGFGPRRLNRYSAQLGTRTFTVVKG